MRRRRNMERVFAGIGTSALFVSSLALVGSAQAEDAAPAPITITALGQDGWTAGDTRDPGVGSFVQSKGFASNLSGKGAFQLDTPNDAAKVQLMRSEPRLKLRDIDQLSYLLYPTTTATVAASINLKLDCKNAQGRAADGYLVFEPRLNNIVTPNAWTEINPLGFTPPAQTTNLWWLSAAAGVTCGDEVPGPTTKTWTAWKLSLGATDVTAYGLNQGSANPGGLSQVSSFTLNNQKWDFEEAAPALPPTLPADTPDVGTINGAPITATPPVVLQGSQVTVTGAGFGNSKSVAVALYPSSGEPVMLTTTVSGPNLDGEVSAVATIPANLPPGSYTLALVNSIMTQASEITVIPTKDARPAPELPADLPANTMPLTVSPASVAAGGTTTVSAPAGSFSPNSLVHLGLYSMLADLGEARSDAAGAISLEVTIPDGLAAGDHNVLAVGYASVLDDTLAQFSAPITLTASASNNVPNGIPAGDGTTGGSSTLPYVFALCAAAGAFLTLRLRRRMQG